LLEIGTSDRMKTSTLAALATFLVGGVNAHYRFTSLIVNGVTTAEYQYVRQYTSYNSPVVSATVNDLRCNTGAVANGATQTYTVASGATVGFKMDQPIYHAGPVSIYLGKAPSTALAWDGSGVNWFKIKEWGATFNPFTFTSQNLDTFTATIPTGVPAGEYLLRVEQIALHVAGAPQWYISCAQLKITGSGSSNYAKVSIPGTVYAASDPGLTVNIYNPVPTSYNVPGPDPVK